MKIATFAAIVLASLAPASGAALQPGEVLPGVQGNNLNNTSVTLPQATAGKAAVVAFGFSRESGAVIRQWAGRIAQESGAVPVYQVPVLEGVPRLFRGLAVNSIKGDTADKDKDNLILLYRDEKLWRDRLEVKDDKSAYLVVIDGNGKVVERVSGAPDNALVAKVKAALNQATAANGAGAR